MEIALTLLRRERELADGGLKPLCRADKVGKQLLAYIHAALVGSEIAFVVRLQENLKISIACSQSVNERLIDRHPIFRSVAFASQRRESKLVRCFDGQVELTVGIDRFVLRVGQATACRVDHAVEFFPRGRLRFEVPGAYEIVELLFGHGRRSFSEPIMKIFGEWLILANTDPLSDVLRFHSLNERNKGCTVLRIVVSAFWAA